MKNLSSCARIFFQPFRLVAARNLAGDKIEGQFSRVPNFVAGHISEDYYGRKYMASVSGALRRIGIDGVTVGRDISQPRPNWRKRMEKKAQNRPTSHVAA